MREISMTPRQHYQSEDSGADLREKLKSKFPIRPPRDGKDRSRSRSPKEERERSRSSKPRNRSRSRSRGRSKSHRRSTSRYSRASECPSPDYNFKTADRSLSWGKIKSKHRRSSSGSPSFKAPTPRKREFKSPKTTEFKTNSFNLESPSWKSKVSHKSSSKSPHREDSSDGRGASTSSKSAYKLGRKAPTYSSDSETEKYLKSSEKKKKKSKLKKKRKQSSSSSDDSTTMEELAKLRRQISKKEEKVKSRKKSTSVVEPPDAVVKQEPLELGLLCRATPPAPRAPSLAPSVCSVSSVASSNSVSVKTEPGTGQEEGELGRVVIGQPQVHKPKPYFRPVDEIEQPILGHTRCNICKTYYPSDDEKAKAHLSQHTDRAFLVTLPSDTYYTNMEDTVLHLLNFGINKDELEKKVESCNLIRYPSNLNGFSCSFCCQLDTSSEREFNFHVKEECGVGLSKEERLQALVPFCRRCHARFQSKADLLLHTETLREKCFPSRMVINRLYDQSRASAPAPPPSLEQKKQAEQQRLIQVKQEKLSQAEQVRVKIEAAGLQMEATPPGPRFDAFAPPTPVHSVPKELSLGPGHRELSLPPVGASISTQALSNIMATAMRGATPQAPPSYPPSPFLSSWPPQIKEEIPPSLGPGPPSVNSLPPLQPLNTTPSGSALTTGGDIESPAFSPLGRRKHRERHPKPSPQQAPPPAMPTFSPLSIGTGDSRRSVKKAVVSPPDPSRPLPSVEDLFSKHLPAPALPPSSPTPTSAFPARVAGVMSTVQAQYEKNSNSSCWRFSCHWTSSYHDPSCPRVPILNRCQGRFCQPSDLHIYTCDKFLFYCNCKKDKLTGNYKYLDNLPGHEVTRISLKVPEGRKDDSVMEVKSSRQMRLLYKVTTKLLVDPRIAAPVYPEKGGPQASCLSGLGWGGKVGRIYPWEGNQMDSRRLNTRGNPHIVLESDDDEDITVCETTTRVIDVF